MPRLKLTPTGRRSATDEHGSYAGGSPTHPEPESFDPSLPSGTQRADRGRRLDTDRVAGQPRTDPKIRKKRAISKRWEITRQSGKCAICARPTAVTHAAPRTRP